MHDAHEQLLPRHHFIVNAALLLLDQDVAFNQNRYMEDAEPIEPNPDFKAEEMRPLSFNCGKWKLQNLGSYLNPSIFDRR